jgi:hypothetical protein
MESSKPRYVQKSNNVPAKKVEEEIKSCWDSRTITFFDSEIPKTEKSEKSTRKVMTAS